MALEKEMAQESQMDEGDLTDEEEDDLKIAVNLAKNLIDDGGYEVIEQALSSSDPGQVIGQFLMQMVSQMAENLPDGVELSPRIFFAYGGWVEQISDYLQDEYDVPRKDMDRAEMFIATAAQQMAQGQAQQQQGAAPAAPAEQAPVMPGGQ